MDFAYKIYITWAALLVPICRGQDGPTADSPLHFEIKIDPDKQDQFFKIGENRLLTCSASAAENNQKPALHWEIEGVKIVATTRHARIWTDYTEDGSLMLRVDPVKDGDGGEYKCVGTLGSQVDSRKIKIDVIRDLEVHSEKSQYGIAEQDGVIECDATANPPPTITWKHEDGTRITSGEKYVIMQSKLTIKNLNEADAQTYLCDIVVIKTGKSMSFYIDYEVVRLPVIIAVPSIEPVNPKVGDEVKIMCKATGLPKPKYSFLRAGNLLPDNMVDEDSGILTLHNLKREDEADYTCVATNRGGKDEKSNRLDVKIPPTIQEIANVTDAAEDGQLEVKCIAEGDPIPTVTWEKQGEEVYSEGARDSGPEIINEDGNNREDAEIKIIGVTMKFSSIKPQDAGLYVCKALNVVGNATQVFKLEVKYAPHFNTYFTQTVFYGWKGHKANLTCLASANELAHISWYKEHESELVRIENNSPYTLNTPQQWPDLHLTSSSLEVYVAESDETVFQKYYCEATNVKGTVRHTVELRKAVPPQRPVVRIPSVQSTKATLEVVAPTDDGGQPVTGYRYTYYPSGDESKKQVKEIDSTLPTVSVELRDLQPNTLYVVNVAARSQVGLGTELPLSLTTLDISRPGKLVILSPHESSEPDSYTLAWDKPEDGGSPITEYIIQHKRVQVEGSDASEWRVVGDIDKKYTVNSVTDTNALTYVIRNLERDTHYEIRFTAMNKIGESDEEFKIIRTSQGFGKGSDAYKVNGTNALLLIILACLSTFW